MANSREIRLDPLYSTRLFHYEPAVVVATEFERPIKIEELPEFLKGETERGKKYKEGFRSIINNIKKWADDNKLESSVCDRFLAAYLNYTGDDETNNKVRFTVYCQGIELLAGIESLLNNTEISLDTRKEKLKNLFNGLMVCGPGTYNNIEHAFRDLSSVINAGEYWMIHRRGIAEQTVFEVMAGYQEDIQEGMEIHYVNGVLNHYSEMIGIPKLEDVYIPLCDLHLLNEMYEQFNLVLFEKLDPDEMLHAAFGLISMDSLQADIESGNVRYSSALKKLEEELVKFGLESKARQFYSQSNIIKLSGEFEDQPRLTWKIKYILFSSLYSRLIEKKYIDLKDESVHPLNEETKISYLPGYSLQFASVQSNGQPYRSPFISYCVEELTKQDPNNDLISFLLSEKLSNLNRAEILVGLENYMRSPEGIEAALADQSLQMRVNNLLEEFLKKQSQLTYKDVKCLLNQLASDQQIIFLKTIGDLAAVITNSHQFANIISKLTNDQHFTFFNNFGWGKISSLILNFDSLTEILKKMQQNKRIIFLEFLDKSWFDFIKSDPYNFSKIIALIPKSQWMTCMNMLGKEHITALFISSATVNDGGLIATILPRLPEDQRGLFLDLLGTNTVARIVSNVAALSDVLKELPHNHWKPFLDFIGKEKIAAMISKFSDLNNLFDTDQFMELLYYIGKAKVIALLLGEGQIMGYTTLKSYIEQFPSEHKLPFLNLLGNDAIMMIIQDSTQLNSFLVTLPENQWIPFFILLGNDNILKIISDINKLNVILELLPTNQVKQFLEFLGKDKVAAIIPEANQLLMMWKQLPLEQQGLLIEFLKEKGIVPIVSNNEQLAESFAQLPEQQQRMFSNYLGYFPKLKQAEQQKLPIELLLSQASDAMLGIGTPNGRPDYANAVRIYMKIIQIDDKYSEKLANIYKKVAFNAEGEDQKNKLAELAINLYATMISKYGSTTAMVSRAEMHRSGLGEESGKPNFQKMMELFKIAIKNGSVDAMRTLADLHATARAGEKLTHDYSEAIKLYKMAIKLKDPDSVPLCERAYFDLYRDRIRDLTRDIREEINKMKNSFFSFIHDSYIKSKYEQLKVLDNLISGKVFNTSYEGVYFPDLAQMIRDIKSDPAKMELVYCGKKNNDGIYVERIPQLLEEILAESEAFEKLVKAAGFEKRESPVPIRPEI